MTTLKIIRLATWGLVVLLAGVTAYGLMPMRADPPSETAGSGTAAVGGPFTAVDVDGKPVDQTIFAGRAHAIFFGFTHCPDICPTTLAEMSVLLGELGPAADALDVYFVSVDPTRDTPEVLKSYLASFGSKIRGLTGSDAEIGAMVDVYRAYRRKVPTGDDGSYTMDHTAAVFLFNDKGAFGGSISYGEPQADALAKLRRLLGA